MRAKEIITEATKGGMIPGLETTGGTTLGKNELSGQFDKYKTGSENPFKKPYKQPSKPTNLPPGVTIKGAGSNNPVTETAYDDPNFNPRVEMARIVNLRLELEDASYQRKQEIAKEIREIEAQIRLWKAAQPEKPAPTKEKKSDKGTPYTIYYDGEVSGRMLDTDLQGAKNVGKRTVMQQQAHTFAIVTDNAGNVVFVWYPGGHERPYEVGDKYNAPNTPDPYKDRPRYPAGHPHAGAPMPSNVPIVTDWSKLPDGGIEAWMQGNQEPEADATAQQRPEVYMGQAQRVDQPGGLPRPRKRK